MNEFMTWEFISTFAGSVAAVSLATQAIKNAPKIKDVPTAAVSYVIALVVLYAATFFTGGLTASMAALVPLNAIAVSVASNGSFEAVKRIKRG